MLINNEKAILPFIKHALIHVMPSINHEHLGVRNYLDGSK